jgi:hypothetical protein
MTAELGPPMEVGAPAKKRPTPTTASTSSVSQVPGSHPWARRPDAHQVEQRYQLSLRLWRRRPACVHGRRADGCIS